MSLDRCKPSPWLCKIAGEFRIEMSLHSDCESEIADCQPNTASHVMVLTDGPWKGNMVALPNNGVRLQPALWVTGEGAPDLGLANIHTAPSR